MEQIGRLKIFFLKKTIQAMKFSKFSSFLLRYSDTKNFKFLYLGHLSD